MRNSSHFVIFVLSIVPASAVGAQRLPTPPDPIPVASVPFSDEGWRDQKSDPKVDRARHGGTLGLTAWPDPRTERKQFIAVGAAIGMIGGAALAVHDTRDGVLGYFGALFTLPLGVVAGGAVGGLAGFLLSLVVYPP